MKEILSIRNIHCKSCERVIEDAVMEINGIKSVDVSYANETAEVEFDPAKTSIKSIIDAINELGYEAKVSDGKTGKGAGLLSRFFGGGKT